jgi:spore germination protein GerM
MSKRFVIVLATGVLAICLLSGGCLNTDKSKSKISDWKDLLKQSVEQKADSEKTSAIETPSVEPVTTQQSIGSLKLNLYFGNASGSKLVAEERSIQKVEGIARRTIEELLKGPKKKEYINVFPEGTKLLDINVCPDGLCIVDLSGEVSMVANQQQEELMVYAIANTLSQFPSIERVRFRIEGEDVDTLAGFVPIGEGIEADHKL